MHTFVIAEIGSAWRWFCAGTSVEAKQAVAIAKSCGADAVKFQWTSDPRKMEQRRNVPERSYDILAWPKDLLAVIAGECRLQDIEFMVTCFLPEDMPTVNPYVKRWKVASLEAEDDNLIYEMSATGKPVVMSHGAMDASKGRMGYKIIKHLHCTAAYPAKLDSLNLSVISNYGYDGYSDHSCDVLTGALAVACGASIVEVHFKLFDTPHDNPDYVHSLWPEQLRDYIANIRKAELMLGDGIKRVMPCEEWALQHKVKA